MLNLRYIYIILNRTIYAMTVAHEVSKRSNQHPLTTQSYARDTIEL